MGIWTASLRVATLTILGAFGLPAVAQHIWEKPVAPGLIYREEVDFVTPRIIHALRFSPQSPLVSARPELFGKTVYEPGNLTGRGPVGELVTQTGALAGINADFFSMAKAPSGNPLGLMVRNGELVALPSKRTVMAWGPKEITFGTSKFTGRIQAEGGIDLPITTFNEKCPKDGLTLNTPAAGLALAEGEATLVTVKVKSGIWSPSTVVQVTVEAIQKSPTTLPVAPGTAILVAQGERQSALTGLSIGQTLAISLKTEGFDWAQVENAVGGGPLIVQNGQPNLRTEEEGFPTSFSTTRHPRTAVGRTAAGDIWFVALDGRQKTSAGASLDSIDTVSQII